MSDQPITEIQAPSLPWYKVWISTYFSPKEQTYRNLLQDPKANTNRAVIWVGASILIIGLVPLLVYWLSGSRFIHDDLVDSGITSQGEIAIVYMLLGVFGAAFIGAPIGMSIASSLIHWIATKMGGEGVAEKFGFLLGAIAAPAYLIDSAIEGIVGNNIIGLSLRFAFPFYQAFLLVIALKAAYNNLSTMKAVGVVMLLALVSALIVGCLVGMLMLLRV